MDRDIIYILLDGRGPESFSNGAIERSTGAVEGGDHLMRFRIGAG